MLVCLFLTPLILCASVAQICSMCDAEEPKFRCSACHGACYCNASCQEKHWRYHSPDCRALVTNGAAAANDKATTNEKLPNAPNKPPSSYMMFCKAERPKIVKENPDMAFGDVGKELGLRWGKLTKAQKDKF